MYLQVVEGCVLRKQNVARFARDLIYSKRRASLSFCLEGFTLQDHPPKGTSPSGNTRIRFASARASPNPLRVVSLRTPPVHPHRFVSRCFVSALLLRLYSLRMLLYSHLFFHIFHTAPFALFYFLLIISVRLKFINATPKFLVLRKNLLAGSQIFSKPP